MGKITTRLVIGDDGVVLTELYDGDRIVRANSIESYKEQRQRQLDYLLEHKDYINYDEFLLVNGKELKLVLEDLDDREKACVLSILPYVRYQSCLICYKNGKAINADDIGSIVGKSRRRALEAIEKLIKKGILYKGRNSHEVQYFFNPFLVKKGQYVDKVLKTMFRNYYIRSLGKKVNEL